ncbi:hypothetical protein KAX17_09270 [Candidatus Bipolaricaulota bacterium]|nr:hypothetical protein [Candidatus Bipolaricaulota bacterium]
MEHQRDELATKRDLDKVERKLTGRIDQVEQRLTDKIDANTVTLDRIAVQVIENREQLSKTLTREEYKKDYNELLRGQDKMMTILTRIDQERAATYHGADRPAGKGRRQNKSG